MKQFTAEKRKLDQKDMDLIERLFPEIKMYDESALELPPHIGINKDIGLAFCYEHKNIHYLDMSQRRL